jgi:hypothetical protein
MIVARGWTGSGRQTRHPQALGGHASHHGDNARYKQYWSEIKVAISPGWRAARRDGYF